MNLWAKQPKYLDEVTYRCDGPENFSSLILVYLPVAPSSIYHACVYVCANKKYANTGSSSFFCPSPMHSLTFV